MTISLALRDNTVRISWQNGIMCKVSHWHVGQQGYGQSAPDPAHVDVECSQPGAQIGVARPCPPCDSGVLGTAAPRHTTLALAQCQVNLSSCAAGMSSGIMWGLVSRRNLAI